LRDQGALESAVAQPEASFGGEELYADLASKAEADSVGLRYFSEWRFLFLMETLHRFSSHAVSQSTQSITLENQGDA
jgi:hypothetical protein